MECEECGSKNVIEAQGEFFCQSCGLSQGEALLPASDRTERQFYGEDNVTHHHRPDPLDPDLPGTIFNVHQAPPHLKSQFYRFRMHQNATNTTRQVPKKVTESVMRDRKINTRRGSKTEVRRVIGNPEYIPDGYLKSDFLKVAKHFNAQKHIQDTGVLIVNRLLKKDDENPVSQGEKRSMNSIRTSSRWAGALVCYLFRKFGGYVSRRTVARYVSERVSGLTKCFGKLIEYEDWFIHIFASHLRDQRGKLPSALVREIVPHDVFAPETIELTETLLQIIESGTSGHTPTALITASLFIVEALNGREADPDMLCKLGDITTVTLKNNIYYLTNQLGCLTLVGTRNKINCPGIRLWLKQYCNLHQKYLEEDQLHQIPETNRMGRVVIINPTEAFKEFLGSFAANNTSEQMMQTINDLLLIIQRSKTGTRLHILQCLIQMEPDFHSVQVIHEGVQKPNTLGVYDYWTFFRAYNFLQAQHSDEAISEELNRKQKDFANRYGIKELSKIKYRITKALFPLLTQVINLIKDLPRDEQISTLKTLRNIH